MSKIYDNWEKLVGAVVRREKDRQLAYCESFNTSSSVDLSSHFSLEIPFAEVPQISGQKLDGADLSNQNIFFSRDLMVMEFEEIRKATRNFGPGNLVGEGSLGGCVYKGWISEHYAAVSPGSGIDVAIKLLNNTTNDFNAKLSDFGIAKDVFKYGGRHEVEGRWGVITPIEDKYGPYVAPEFVNAGGSRSTKCDVHSFGVVLLELISGHRAGKERKEWKYEGIMNMVGKRKLSRIMDSRLEGEYHPKEAYKVAKIALQCVSFDPILRPTMADVVAELENL